MGYLGESDSELHIIYGTVSDKDPSAVLDLIPPNSVMYWCAADVPRSMEAEVLKGIGERVGLSGEAYASVNSALVAARQFAHGEDGVRVVVCGSVYVVGEVVDGTT
jgi:folylpolyglutamate synthase/dihydropteroate synthase